MRIDPPSIPEELTVLTALPDEDTEIENARRTIPLVQLDSRLGFEPSMEYIGDEAHILWKIETTQKALEEEILPLLDR